jgi:hypothetical protein
MSNTVGVLSEAGTAYPSRAPEFTPDIILGSLLPHFLVFVMFYYVSLLSDFRDVMFVTMSA